MDMEPFTTLVPHPVVFVGGPLDGMAATVGTAFGIPPSEIAPKLPRRLRTGDATRAGYRLDVVRDSAGEFVSAVEGPPLRRGPGHAFRYIHDPSLSTHRPLLERIATALSGGDVSPPFPARQVIREQSELELG
jgi:hypothetical protein